jgi:hypothetical protein
MKLEKVLDKAKYMTFSLVGDLNMSADFVWNLLVHAYSRMKLSCVFKQMDRLCGLESEFLATDPEARVRFPALPEKKK